MGTRRVWVAKTKENLLAVVALGVKMKQQRKSEREAFERNL